MADHADMANDITERAQIVRRSSSATKRSFAICQYCADPSGGKEFCCEECRIDGERMKFRLEAKRHG